MPLRPITLVPDAVDVRWQTVAEVIRIGRPSGLTSVAVGRMQHAAAAQHDGRPAMRP